MEKSGRMPIEQPVGHCLRDTDDSEEVAPYLDAVCEEADAETNALGFFRRRHLGQWREKAVSTSRVRQIRVNMLGICFSMHRFHGAKILQVHCAQVFRRQGVAHALLTAAIDRLTHECYLTLQARVAEDLHTANDFWSAQGFDVQRVETGRGKKPRRIVVRIRELDSPQLLRRSALSSSRHNILGLRLPDCSGLPLLVTWLTLMSCLIWLIIGSDMK